MQNENTYRIFIYCDEIETENIGGHNCTWFRFDGKKYFQFYQIEIQISPDSATFRVCVYLRKFG